MRPVEKLDNAEAFVDLFEQRAVAFFTLAKQALAGVALGLSFFLLGDIESVPSAGKENAGERVNNDRQGDR